MKFNERLLLINSLIKEINRDLSVDHAINILVKGGMKLLSVDAGVFALIDDDKLRCMSQSNFEFDVEMFCSDFGLQVEKTTVIRDIKEHPDLCEKLQRYEVKSLICTPVNIMTDKKGVLFLASFTEREFSEPDINSLEIFLDAGVSTIKNSFLFDLISKSQKLWQETFDAISDYVFVVDDDCRIIKCNIAFAESCGLHPRKIIGKSCLELQGKLAPTFCIEELYKNRKAYTEEITCDGKIYLVSGFHVTLPNGKNATVHILKDITEMRRLKEQLYHADKLTSLGLLVSGVAHELNNPLTGILGYSELLTMKAEDEVLKKELGKIYSAAER
ncbi:MAG TPA: PAS domain-containing protein, partial [Nitrospirae bacterium]|nr:PAS domain-containing protein [Nitrospirota bacterium]